MLPEQKLRVPDAHNSTSLSIKMQRGNEMTMLKCQKRFVSRIDIPKLKENESNDPCICNCIVDPGHRLTTDQYSQIN